MNATLVEERARTRRPRPQSPPAARPDTHHVPGPGQPVEQVARERLPLGRDASPSGLPRAGRTADSPLDPWCLIEHACEVVDLVLDCDPAEASGILLELSDNLYAALQDRAAQ